MIYSRKEEEVELSNRTNDQVQDEVVDLQAFQARLEASFDNIQALVESWIPKELQLTAPSPSGPSLSTFNPHSSRPRNSRLGLGSSVEKKIEPRIDKIRNQLIKHNNKKRDAESYDEGSFNQAAALDEDEDSRTSTFNQRSSLSSTKQSSFSLLHEPSSKATKLSASSAPRPLHENPSTKSNNYLNHNDSHHDLPEPSSSANSCFLVANNSGSLSKRQIKKLRKLERAKLLTENHASSLNNLTSQNSIRT